MEVIYFLLDIAQVVAVIVAIGFGIMALLIAASLFIFIFPIVIGIYLLIQLWSSGEDNAAVIIFLACIAWQIWWVASGAAARTFFKFTALIDGPPKRRKCPKCDSEKIKLLKTDSSYITIMETVTQTTKHYNVDDVDDVDEIGYSETEVEVPTTSEVTTKYFECNSCHHTWTD